MTIDMMEANILKKRLCQILATREVRPVLIIRVLLI
jgi:hypothetical protein